MTIEEFIISREGRFDKSGNLIVYQLPSGDGGGTYEVAGINDRYHPKEAAHLRDLIESGKHQLAREFAGAYIRSVIAPVLDLHPEDAVNRFMGVLAFNRGLSGARTIAQQAMRQAGVYSGELDGIWGPKSERGFRAVSSSELLPRLLIAWTWYERVRMARDERNKFWNGLVNRHVAAFRFAIAG